ncbi:MAG: class I SAM-dependent methyltransferase [Bacteroidia bacterium]|nr:class I SAM-dependent methyltransferase [Bacteroidia bacterium]
MLQFINQENEAASKNLEFWNLEFKNLSSKLNETTGNISKDLLQFKNQENNNIIKLNTEFINLNSNIIHGIETINSDIKQNLIQSKNEQFKALESLISSMKWELSTTYDRIDALLSIHQLIELNNSLPIMNDWTISSDFGQVLIKNILSQSNGDVIDIGSGITTILSGYALKKRGNGKVISLEHDTEYFKKTKLLIEEHKLDEIIELYHCPLIEYDINGEKWLWYDIQNIKFSNNIGIIIVDGPPGSIQNMARFPAIPILKKYIGEKTIILLDDGGREDEKKVAETWESCYNLKKRFIKNHKGLFELYK